MRPRSLLPPASIALPAACADDTTSPVAPVEAGGPPVLAVADAYDGGPLRGAVFTPLCRTAAR